MLALRFHGFHYLSYYSYITDVSLQVCTVCHHDIILELLTIIPTLTHYHGKLSQYACICDVSVTTCII